MKNIIKKLISIIASPVKLISLLIEESRNINEYGDWNTYHARKNSEV